METGGELETRDSSPRRKPTTSANTSVGSARNWPRRCAILERDVLGRVCCCLAEEFMRKTYTSSEKLMFCQIAPGLFAQREDHAFFSDDVF